MEPFKLRKLAANFSFLTGGEIFSKICTFAAFTFLARTLGPQQFGYLEFTLAVMVFFTLFVDFGSSPYGAREIALNRENIPLHVSNIFTMRLFLAAISVLVIIIAVQFLPDSYQKINTLLLVFSFSLLGMPFFLQWVFQGLDNMKWVALGSIIRQLVFAAAVFLYFRKTTPLWHVGLLEALAVLSFLIYNILIFKSRIGPLRFKFNLAALPHTLRQTSPIGLSEIGWASMWYSATIMLGMMVGGKDVGWFGVAHRTVMAIHAFVWLYFYNLLPSISRCKHHPEKILQNLMNHSMFITSWSSIFFGIIATVFAQLVITILYGREFEEAAQVFSVLAWMIPISLLSGHYRYSLIAYRLQKYEFYSTIIAAILAIVLGFLFIPQMGALGAAFALIIAKLVNFLLAYWYVQKHISHIPLLPHVYKPLFATGVFVIVFFLLYRVNFWMAGAAAAISFLTLLFAMEWRRIFRNQLFQTPKT